MINEEKIFDALFVINQDCEPDTIREICSGNSYSKIFILTTHYLFENERRLYSAITPGGCVISHMSALLTDAELERCDEYASASMLSIYENDAVKQNYTHFFMNASLWFKNKSVYEKLCVDKIFKSVYYYPGLGVSSQYWSMSGASPVDCLPVCERGKSVAAKNSFRNLLKNPFRFIRHCFSSSEVTLVKVSAGLIVFFTPVKRIKFDGRAAVLKIKINNYKYLSLSSLNSQIDIYKRFIDRLKRKHNVFIGTSIHEYRYEFIKNFESEKILLFIDGFHPANYPRSYIDSYAGVNFVIRDVFGADWFVNNKKSVIKPRGYHLLELMNEKAGEKPPAVKTIVLVLNHAGDWTALINRSDTDILIEKFCMAAREFGGNNFIVRLHPTMAHRSHEGVNSMKRVAEYIKWLNLSNLSLSELTLEQDIKRGDLFVSEYSQVLLDSLIEGKLSVMANFTGRRSFFADFEKIGFTGVSTYEEFVNVIKDINANISKYFKKQREAMNRYNDLNREFYYDDKKNN
jgi:hypothetical protein